MSGNQLTGAYAGRRAIITGSTHGIGLAVADKLADGGADVVLNYKENSSNADSVVEEIKSRGRRCVAIQADLSDVNECSKLVEEGIKFLGGLDFLVLNAGPFGMGTIAETAVEKWRYILDVNFTGSYQITQACIEELRRSDYPSIVYIGGVNTGVIAAHPRMAIYAAAKAGLAVLMRTVAVEEGPNGIRANMVCPGYIDTGGYSEEFKGRAVEEIPLRRIGEPSDVADVVCWLLTEDARYVTGAIIDAGGGLWV